MSNGEDEDIGPAPRPRPKYANPRLDGSDDDLEIGPTPIILETIVPGEAGVAAADVASRARPAGA